MSKHDDGGAATEFAWLIETGGHRYWNGRRTDAVAFTKNPDEAVRFAREADADRVIYWLLEPYKVFLVARHHGFMASAHKTPETSNG